MQLTISNPRTGLIIAFCDEVKKLIGTADRMMVSGIKTMPDGSYQISIVATSTHVRGKASLISSMAGKGHRQPWRVRFPSVDLRKNLPLLVKWPWVLFN